MRWPAMPRGDALRRLHGGLDRAGTGTPATLVLIIASGYSYQRSDGVSVAPGEERGRAASIQG